MDMSYYKNMEPIFGEWQIKKFIGEGNFGKVFEIERKDFGRTYTAALKVITIPQSESEIKTLMADDMDEKSITVYFRGFVEEIVDEFALMAKLKGNSNIVSYEDHKVIEHKNGFGWDILIRMELLTPLLDHVKEKGGMTEKDVIQLGIDLCRALETCQKMNIIHRDIKPENIFISETGNYKLGDFGIARTAEKTTSGLSKKGTYTYMAPEVYLGKPYGPNVDIYSLGLVLYRYLNNNRAPFLPAAPNPITYSDKESAMSRRINGEELPAPANASEKLAAIVLKACAHRSTDRFRSPEEMRLQLEHLLGGPDEKKSNGTPVDEVKKEEHPYIPPVIVQGEEPIDQEDSGTISIFSVHKEHRQEKPLKPAEPEKLPKPEETAKPAERVMKEEPGKNNKKMLMIGVAVGCLALVWVLVLCLTFLLGGGSGDIGAESAVSTEVSGDESVSSEDIRTMPSVIDSSEQDAKALLDSLGVAATVEKEYSSTVADGIVIRASVGTGDPLTEGAAVVLYVSQGPEPVQVEPLFLNRTSMKLKVGGTGKLTASGGEGAYTWKVGNRKVATVNNGTVTAVGEGTTRVMVTAGEATATCYVTVTKPTSGSGGGNGEGGKATQAKSLGSLSDSKITVHQGYTALVVAYPVSGAGYTWSSSNESVATVSGTGRITGVSPGKATITATFIRGKDTERKTCTVTVVPKN